MLADITVSVTIYQLQSEKYCKNCVLHRRIILIRGEILPEGNDKTQKLIILLAVIYKMQSSYNKHLLHLHAQ